MRKKWARWYVVANKIEATVYQECVDGLVFVKRLSHDGTLPLAFAQQIVSFLSEEELSGRYVELRFVAEPEFFKTLHAELPVRLQGLVCGKTKAPFNAGTSDEFLHWIAVRSITFVEQKLLM